MLIKFLRALKFHKVIEQVKGQDIICLGQMSDRDFSWEPRNTLLVES